MKAKEAFVRTSAFLKLPKYFGEPPTTFPGITNIKVTQKSISRALTTQAATKTSRPDQIPF